jgi:hypothetical protein
LRFTGNTPQFVAPECTTAEPRIGARQLPSRRLKLPKGWDCCPRAQKRRTDSFVGTWVACSTRSFVEMLADSMALITD